ncbi:uncharacterized protein LOC127867507 [Dreissena polymorpha]|uniref:EF-hand domain-containing protein n=1 Tax=Dreissena polymorpha TaxID=45954 RepID=A0A9D4S4K2_DREPO|nr:uncharacterized protein LOC127867507 [Dreissena polymorpha]KAH3892289.1 hypothetical protein DPMN_016404 [Dreissena polymorpha]
MYLPLTQIVILISLTNGHVINPAFFPRPPHFPLNHDDLQVPTVVLKNRSSVIPTMSEMDKPGNSLIDSIKNTVQNIHLKTSTDGEGTKLPAQIRGVTNVCSVICPRWCEKQSRPGANVTHCHIVCGDLCEGQMQSNNPYVGNPYFEVVATDFEFERYDTDGDKRISVNEFAAEENVPVEDAQKTFDFSDFNDDGFIDVNEFHGGPFIFTVQMAAEFSNMGRIGQKAAA